MDGKQEAESQGTEQTEHSNCNSILLLTSQPFPQSQRANTDQNSWVVPPFMQVKQARGKKASLSNTVVCNKLDSRSSSMQIMPLEGCMSAFASVRDEQADVCACELESRESRCSAIDLKRYAGPQGHHSIHDSGRPSESRRVNAPMGVHTRSLGHQSHAWSRVPE
jgi:hypothetical protein